MGHVLPGMMVDARSPSADSTKFAEGVEVGSTGDPCANPGGGIQARGGSRIQEGGDTLKHSGENSKINDIHDLLNYCLL